MSVVNKSNFVPVDFLKLHYYWLSKYHWFSSCKHMEFFVSNEMIGFSVVHLSLNLQWLNLFNNVYDIVFPSPNFHLGWRYNWIAFLSYFIWTDSKIHDILRHFGNQLFCQVRTFLLYIYMYICCEEI